MRSCLGVYLNLESQLSLSRYQFSEMLGSTFPFVSSRALVEEATVFAIITPFTTIMGGLAQLMSCGLNCRHRAAYSFQSVEAMEFLTSSPRRSINLRLVYMAIIIQTHYHGGILFVPIGWAPSPNSTECGDTYRSQQPPPELPDMHISPLQCDTNTGPQGDTPSVPGTSLMCVCSAHSSHTTGLLVACGATSLFRACMSPILLASLNTMCLDIKISKAAH